MARPPPSDHRWGITHDREKKKKVLTRGGTRMVMYHSVFRREGKCHIDQGKGR